MKTRYIQLPNSTVIYLIIILPVLLCQTCQKSEKQKEPVFLNASSEEFIDATPRSIKSIEKLWKIRVLMRSHFWEADYHMARVYKHNNKEFVVYLYEKEGHEGYYLSAKPLFQNENTEYHISSELNIKWDLKDNFRQVGETIYFYTADDSAYHFSLHDFVLINDDEYPFEIVDWVNAVISPDRKSQVYWTDTQLYLKDLETGQTELLFAEEYKGDWSIGDVIWSNDSKRLYFDNSGPVACIWEYDLEASTLNKIVQDHKAIHPYYFSKDGSDYLIYVEDHTIRLATNASETLQGFFDQKLIRVDGVHFPLTVIEKTETNKFLKVMIYKTLEETGRYDYEWGEEESGENVLWKLGTVMTDPYQGGILYRNEFIVTSKERIDYSVTRFIKLKNRVIILPQSSSKKNFSTSAKFFPNQDEQLYPIGLYNQILSSELFTGCKEVVIDYSVAIDGIYIPDILRKEPKRFSVVFKEEFLIKQLKEENGYRKNDIQDFKEQLKVLYHDSIMGDIYVETDVRRQDKHPALKYRGGGLFAFTKDESVLVYGLIPDFKPKIYNASYYEYKNHVCITDVGYRDDGIGDLDIACIYSEEELFETPGLTIIGENSFGDTIWGFPGIDHPLLRQEYDRIEQAFGEHQFRDQERLLSYEEFIQEDHVYYWKDPFGRYIRFINRDFLSPLIAEPVIYIYDTKKSEITIQPGARIRVTHSYPRIETRWHVTGSDSGKVKIIPTGKEYDYLFWEGYAGYLPRKISGYVVSKNDIPRFIDQKLTCLGLLRHEIDDFKKAWLPEFSNSPWYFITFYDQETIDQFIPLKINPHPETIIRILMDYRALDTPVKIPEPEFITPPERTGLTIVEWGGLIR